MTGAPKFFGDGSCAVCDQSVRPGYLMCPYHWRTVPSSLKSAVWKALDQWNAGQIDLAELRAVQQRAVDAVGRIQ